MEFITSAKNPIIQNLRGLREHNRRVESGRILVEGMVMIREALKCEMKIHDLIADEKYAAFAEEMNREGARSCIVPKNLLESVCDTKTPQGVCASFDAPEPIAVELLADVVVALDGVQDPGNLGTIWRTADAAGFQGLLVGCGSADPLSPKVLRAAMGSGFRIPFAQAENLTEALKALKVRGYTLIASDLSGEDFYARSNPGRKLVLIIGNEAHGISASVRACADMRVKLPMRGGAESLNAAIAAAILMYDLMREYEK